MPLYKVIIAGEEMILNSQLQNKYTSFITLQTTQLKYQYIKAHATCTLYMTYCTLTGILLNSL